MPIEKLSLARLEYSETKMERLIYVLQKLDDDDNADISKLSRTCSMSQAQLKLHHHYTDHWR